MFTTLKDKLKIIWKTQKFFYDINKRAVLLRYLSIIVNIIANLLTISLGGKFLDATKVLLESWTNFSFKEYFYTDSFRILLYILLVWIIKAMFSHLRSYYYQVLNGDFEFYFKDRIIRKMASSNLQEVEDKAFQNSLSYVQQFSYGKMIDINSTFLDLVQQTIRFVSISIILFKSIHWLIIFPIIFSLPETTIYLIRSTQIREYLDQRISVNKYIGYLEMIALQIRNFIELKVDNIFFFILQDREHKASRYYKDLYNKYFHLESDVLLTSSIGQALIRGFIVFIVAFSVTHRLSIGAFSATVAYVLSLYNASYFIFFDWFNIFNNVGYIERFFSFLETAGFGEKYAGEAILPKACPSIRLETIDFKYPGSSSKILTDISFEAHPGDKILIVGSDGSGKSSLVKVLAALYKITAGDYVISEFSIRELARGELKNRISLLSQDFVKYNLSIKKNVVIAGYSKKFNKNLYKQALRISGMDKVMKQYGWKDSQVLGKYFGNGVDISPGYWQRLAIARAIYRDKQILIFDEPFIFIDEESRKQILKELFDYVGDERILILLSKDSQHASLFDKVYYLKDGKLSSHKNKFTHK